MEDAAVSPDYELQIDEGSTTASTLFRTAPTPSPEMRCNLLPTSPCDVNLWANLDFSSLLDHNSGRGRDGAVASLAARIPFEREGKEKLDEAFSECLFRFSHYWGAPAPPLRAPPPRRAPADRPAETF